MPSFKLKEAFTLIELLISVALIAIVVVTVVAALNPTQRIIDAQTASIRAQVAAIGSALDICMNHYNSATGTTNGYTNCNSPALLSAATTPGGPFLKTSPTGVWTFQASATPPTNLNGCVYTSVSIGGNTVYAQYRSADHSVTLPPLPTAAPTCP